MQVNVIPQRARRNHRILLVFRAHLRKRVVGLGVDHRTFFNPACLVLFCLDAQKSATVLQHFQRLPVDNQPHAVRYGRYAVMQIHLPCRNIHRLMFLVMQSRASRA